MSPECGFWSPEGAAFGRCESLGDGLESPSYIAGAVTDNS